MVIDLFIPHDPALRCIVLILALMLDAWLGEPQWLWRNLPHPVVLFGRAIGFFERHFNRRDRTGRTRRMLGVVAIIILILLAAGTGGGIMAAASIGGNALTIPVELVLVAILIAGRSLDDHTRAVAIALEGGSMKDARRAISMIVGRNPDALDAHAIARAGIETTAENLSDGVIAPALFYLLFGLPGIIAYKMINTADSMTGYKSRRYFAYGYGAARIDDLVNLIPARLTGLLIALASPAGFFGAIRVMWRDAGRHRSPNAGWPEAAMAARLGLSLAGPRLYGQRMSQDAPMNGEGRREATASDIRRSLSLMWRAIALAGLLTGMAGLAIITLTGSP